MITIWAEWSWQGSDPPPPFGNAKIYGACYSIPSLIALKCLQKEPLSKTTFESNHRRAKPQIGCYCLLVKLPNKARAHSVYWLNPAKWDSSFKEIENKPWNSVTAALRHLKLTAMGIWEEGTYRVRVQFYDTFKQYVGDLWASLPPWLGTGNDQDWWRKSTWRWESRGQNI